MEGTEKLVELQRQWLSSLEAQYELVNKNLKAFLSAPPLQGSELGSWASYLSQVEAYLAQYRAMAVYLKDLGFGRLFERLEQIVTDVHRAGGTYAEMYRNALDSEKTNKAAQEQVSSDWIDTMQNAMKTNQQVFEAALKQWHELLRK